MIVPGKVDRGKNYCPLPELRVGDSTATADIGNGCMGTVYRVRQVGVGAAFDVLCDGAALRHCWPRQAESALQRFDEGNPQPLQ